MTDAELVRDALLSLTWRAKVRPEDDSRAAAQSVRDVIERDSCEQDSVESWLSAATGIRGALEYDPAAVDEAFILVTEKRVVVYSRRALGGERTTVHVPLPAAVTAMIELRPAPTAVPRPTRSVKRPARSVKVQSACGKCGAVRTVTIETARRAAGRGCYQCRSAKGAA
jgi:hypothetical protein